MSSKRDTKDWRREDWENNYGSRGQIHMGYGSDRENEDGGYCERLESQIALNNDDCRD